MRHRTYDLLTENELVRYCAELECACADAHTPTRCVCRDLSREDQYFYEGYQYRAIVYFVHG